MSLKKKIKRIIVNKKIFELCLIFLLSATNFYGGIYPFGLSAFATWGGEFSGAALYFAGVFASGGGKLNFFRHTASFSAYIILQRIFGRKIPGFLMVGIASLIGGVCSVFIATGDKTLYIGFILAEVLISAVFTFIFGRSKNALFDRMRTGSVTDADFAFLIITLMCVFLSFSDIETGRLSLSAALMLLSGMASSYKHTPTVSVAINMAAGFFTMLFTPENVSSVAYMTLSGFVSALLKRYGKFTVPLIYMLFYPLFLGLDIHITTFYVEDIVAASFVFLIIPAKIMDLINVIPKAEKKEDSPLKISERISMLSDTFYSISELFSKMEIRSVEKKAEDAYELTIKEVCHDCIYKSGCKENVAEMLKSLADKKKVASVGNIKCIRKRELINSFLGICRSMRIQNVWQNHIKEENAALINQMTAMAEMLKEVCSKEEAEIFRNEDAEREIVTELRKNGIKTKKIVAGRNGNGVFRVLLELVPCKEGEFCDGLIPGIIKNVLGFEVIRYGMKRCESCRVCYTESPGFKVETALATISAEEISGDSSRFSYVDSEHFVVALSDGMGTGSKAKYKSSVATELALRLLSLGMDLPSSASMVNSLLLRHGENDFVTLDMARINLETGEVEFTKNASAAGYVLRCGGKVNTLMAEGSPLGIVGEAVTGVGNCRISEGDFLILVTDGVSDCFKDGEKGLAEKIEEFTAGSASELADYIMTEAFKMNSRKIKDDMTVIAVGCIKKQKSGNDSDKGGSVYEKRQKSNYFR